MFFRVRVSGGSSRYISPVNVAHFQHLHVLSCSSRSLCFLFNGNTVPHKNVDFASAISSFGMQHADSGGLPHGPGRRSAGTSGCHGYIAIAENLIGNLSMVLVMLP
jgi:hypothetical protein